MRGNYLSRVILFCKWMVFLEKRAMSRTGTTEGHYHRGPMNTLTFPMSQTGKYGFIPVKVLEVMT